MSSTSMNRAIGLSMVFLACLPLSAGCSSEGLDTTPPTTPMGVGAAAPGSSQINLSWAAATDNVGVTGYRVERCQGAGCASFVQIATSAGTTFGDTGLTAATSYSYRVKAVDAATNVSVNYSTVASAATQAAGTATQPIFLTEVHSAIDASTLPPGAPQSTLILSSNVSGTNTLLLAAWHSEWDGGFPDGWTVTSNGVPSTSIVDTDGYTGGAGNRRFRIYYWLNPPPGLNTVVVTNPAADITPNELVVSGVLLGNVAQASPLGPIALDVSTSARTGESETAPTTTNDLGVHMIADTLIVRGTLGNGETSRSVANDGAHPAAGDASLWVSTKPGGLSSTPVSSSGWASRVINGAAIVVRGHQSDLAQMKQRFLNKVRTTSVRTSCESSERAPEAAPGRVADRDETTQPRIVPSAVLLPPSEATPRPGHVRTYLPNRASCESKPGDSLWKLAHKHATINNELKRINGLSTDVVHAGRRLILPSSTYMDIYI